MKFSKFTHAGNGPPPGKFVELKAGKMAKDTRAQRDKFTFETVDTDLDGVAEILRTSGSNVYLTSGTSEHARGHAYCTARLNRMLAAGEPLEISGLPVVGIGNDDLPHRPGPGLLVIDTDDNLATKAAEQLAKALPGVLDHRHIITSSAGSNIYTETGEELAGLGGCHTYIPALDATDIPRALETAHQRMWLAGFGYVKIGKNGAAYLRSPVDLVTRVPSQPIFIRSTLGSGLVQRKTVEVLGTIDAPVDTRKLIPDLTPLEQAELGQLQADAIVAATDKIRTARVEYTEERATALVKANPGMSREHAVGLIHSVSKGQSLPGDWVIYTRDGPVTVLEVLANPDRYHRQPCADPLEPSYTDYRPGVATIFVDGNPGIHSFAHSARSGAFYPMTQGRGSGPVDVVPMQLEAAVDAFVERVIAKAESERGDPSLLQRLTATIKANGTDPVPSDLDGGATTANELVALDLDAALEAYALKGEFEPASAGDIGTAVVLESGEVLHASMDTPTAVGYLRALFEASPDIAINLWPQLAVAALRTSDPSDPRLNLVAKGMASRAGLTQPKARDALVSAASEFAYRQHLLFAQALPHRTTERATVTPEELELRQHRAKLRDRETNPSGLRIPMNYEMTASGLVYTANETPALIAGRFTVLARTRDEKSADWGLLVAWKDVDGREHEMAVSLGDLAGDGTLVRKALMSEGLFISPEISHRNALATFLLRVDIDTRVQAVRSIGFHDGKAFVLPHRTIVSQADAGDLVVYQGKADRTRYADKGDLADWKAKVAAPMQNSTAGALALCTAFTGPLLPLVSAEGGIVHLRGASSIGKSSCLIAATSVWGDPRTYVSEWRATANGLEGIASQANHTLLALDEIHQLKPTEAVSVAYLLGNGRGKQRANQEGEAREPARWLTSTISTGEVGLGDLVKQANGGHLQAGQEVRFLDVSAEEEPQPVAAGEQPSATYGIWRSLGGFADGAALSNHIRTSAASAYGLAGPAFVSAILAREADEVVGFVKRARKDFIADTTKLLAARATEAARKEAVAKREAEDGAGSTDQPELPEKAPTPTQAEDTVYRLTEQAGRGLDRFALIAAAGELAVDMGVLPWARDVATARVQSAAIRWVEGRGKSNERAEEREAVAAIAHFIERYGQSRFLPLEEDFSDLKRVSEMAGWVSGADETLEYLFQPQVWRSDVLRGFDMLSINRLLTDRGILTGSGGKHSRIFRIKNLGPRRLYAVRASELL